MRRINSPDNQFHNGNPLQGQLGTVVTAEWLNAVQEEIAAAIEVVEPLDPVDSGQLAKILALLAVLASPQFTGTPTAPTAQPGTSTAQIATTAFVADAVGRVVAAAPTVLNTLNKLANALNNDPNFATTMANALATKAALASPALTGTPTAPTAAPGTNTTQIATTAFVLAVRDALVNGAPGALDTLGELATALQNNEGGVTGIVNALAGKANTGGDNVSGTWGINITGGAGYSEYLTGPAHTSGTDGWFRSVGPAGWINESYGGGIFCQDTNWVRVYNGFSFYVPANLAAVGTITAYYSDERLKTRLRNIPDALGKVLSLSGFEYTNNDLAKSVGYTDEQVQIGLSAQEVQRVAPSVVSLAPFDMETQEDGTIASKSGENYLTMDYGRMVPLLVEAIKAQQEQISALHKEIDQLKEANNG